MKWKFLCLALLPLFLCCKKQQDNGIDVEANLADTALLKFNNVVILGNSVTYSQANPSIGWVGNWGMAASSAASDYAHILESRFKVQNPNVVVRVKSIRPFEFDPDHYDFDAELKDLKDTRPDLVIIKLGENISVNGNISIFEKRYADLVSYFKSDNENIIVLSGGSVWSTAIDDIVAKHPPYVLLSTILKDRSNFATGLFSDPAVNNHPGDKGMLYIASLMWARIKTLK